MDGKEKVIVKIVTDTSELDDICAKAERLKSFYEGREMEYDKTTTYRLLTDNYGSAVAISYNILEEYEIAYRLGEVEKDGAGTGGGT